MSLHCEALHSPHSCCWGRECAPARWQPCLCLMLEQEEGRQVVPLSSCVILAPMILFSACCQEAPCSSFLG